MSSEILTTLQRCITWVVQ